MTAYYNEIDPKAAAWLRELIKQGHIAQGDVDETDIRDLDPDRLGRYTQCHFFAGIGGWSLALRLAGWPDDRPVWTGSCPCQPFSAAGRRAGTADERHLWPHWHHLISQCQPAVVFGEQVASKDGLGWLDLVQADLEATGYAVAAQDICAAGVGAPHIRQRLWFVGLADAHCERHAGFDALLRPEEGRWITGALPETARSGPAGRLADAADEGFQIGRRGQGEQPGSVEQSERLRADERLGDANHQRSQEHGELGDLHLRQPDGQGQGRQHINAGVAGWLADADGFGAQRWAGDNAEAAGFQAGECQPENRADVSQRGSADYCGRRDVRGDGLSANAARPSPTDGHWRDADWLFCRDGKWRPVEPSTFPLAHGASDCLANVLSVCGIAAERINDYAERTKTDPDKVLRMVRECLYQTEDRQEQSIGMCGELYAPQVLFDFMLSQATACDGAADSRSIKKAGKQTVAGAMRIMRVDSGFMHTPHRREPLKQRPDEPANTLHELSFILARDTQAFGQTVLAAHAALNRVGMLRGYGNAIVPQVAATWIEAVMEYDQ